MYSMRGRTKSGKRQPDQWIYDDVQPIAEWTQDPVCHVLHLDLPGFKKEEIKVQINKTGKLEVRCKRKLTHGRYSRVEKDFEAPKDSDVDKIRMTIEDGGLSFIMPKKVIETKEVFNETKVPPTEVIEEIEEPQKEVIEETKELQKEVIEEIEEPQKEMIEEMEEPQKEVIEEVEVIPQEDVPSYEMIKEEKPISKEEVKTGDEDGDEKVEISGEKHVVWKERVDEELDKGPIDSLLEKIYMNRRLIAMVGIAFFIGYFVSEKLRSRR